jgi:hypothetical protein
MKKIAIVIMIVVVCSPVYAAKEQKAVTYDKDRQVLLSEGGPSGGYGDFKMKAWQCAPANAIGVVFEGGGGAIFNKQMLLGGYGGALITNIDSSKIKAGKTGSFSMGYGGIRVGYIFNPESVYHFSVNSLIGAGTMGYKQTDGSITDNRNFLLIEPGVDCEVNVATNLKCSIGLSYRLLLGVVDQGQGINDAAGSGFNVVASLSFGRF